MDLVKHFLKNSATKTRMHKKEIYYNLCALAEEMIVSIDK